MALTPGTPLGPYEIGAPLWAGGMGRFIPFGDVPLAVEI